ncbi:MAG: type I-C CRISPR-associated protein Cas7/Csd2, partial [Lachnospiraceae bacterium]
DPLNGNRPRTNYDGFGEISDVCIKRKIRNRLLDMGEDIFVQSDDKNVDGFKSLRERADSCYDLRKLSKEKTKEDYGKMACERWFDVRSFGQVFAFKGIDVSLGIRGPVSIHSAVSIAPVDISSMQITKSVNSEAKEGKASDTMGMKHRVDFGVYLIYGSINTQLAEKTGFSDADAEKIKEALITLFENDSSAARPDGSMEVHKLYWWKHNSKTGQYSSAKVHRALNVNVEKINSLETIVENLSVTNLEGLVVEEYEGL